MGRDWNALVAASLSIIAVGCGDQPDPADQPDCRAAEARLDACVRANAKQGGRALLLACIPYSKPQRIVGTWAGDFEFNVFFDGQEVTADRALSNPVPPAALADGPELVKNAAGIPQTTVKYLEFDGRRPLCRFDPGPEALIVDRIVSERIVDTRPSPWAKKGVP